MRLKVSLFLSKSVDKRFISILHVQHWFLSDIWEVEVVENGCENHTDTQETPFSYVRLSSFWIQHMEINICHQNKTCVILKKWHDSQGCVVEVRSQWKSLLTLWQIQLKSLTDEVWNIQLLNPMPMPRTEGPTWIFCQSQGWIIGSAIRNQQKFGPGSNIQC